MTTDPIARLNAALEGRYRIERELGEGGMATVYLAEDLRHERKVALKVLKPELAAVVGADRFLAEIKTTANLQHPHILPLHDSGEADGFLFFVMPYIEGDTLRDKIDREKQLGVDEAVAIAVKVASALDHAHKQGVVHRDIKPGNILLSGEGEPMVADFGIALAVAQAGGGRVTETGLSLGTPHYMSPEQATGDRDVDPRTDVYALGSVLFEMLTGDPPYQGSTAQAVLGQIITGKPVSAAEKRPSIPAHVDGAIAKALEKLPADRFATAQDFTRALTDLGFRHGEAAAVGAATGRRQWTPLAIGLAVLALVSSAALAWSVMRSGPPTTPVPTRRFTIDFPQAGVFRPNTVIPLVLTADGESVILNIATVESGQESGQAGSQLYLRSLGSLEMAPIRGTENIGSFFASPDGEWVAYNSSDETLRKIPIGGGPSATIAETPGSFPGFRGASWGNSGVIVYASGEYRGLMQVPDVGGTPELLTAPEDGEVHRDPHVVPGGATVLFSVLRDGESSEIAALSVESGEYELLTSGTNAHYVEGGYIVFRREDALWVAAFDPAELSLTTEPVPVAEGLSEARPFGISREGTLLYVEGSADRTLGSEEQLTEVDLEGNETPLVLGPRDIGTASWSPDGTSIVYSSEGHIYTYNVELGTTPRQITFEGLNGLPVFSPGGDRVAFSSNRTETLGADLWVKDLNDDSPPRSILRLEANQYVTQWPADTLIIFEWDERGSRDLWTVSLSDPDSAIAGEYLSSEADVRYMQVSPDGALAAYTSDESGDYEIYVRSFPDPGERTIVSQSEGDVPFWSPDGNTLYYWRAEGALGGTFMAVRLQRDPVPVPVSTDSLFTVNGPMFSSTASLHPDGDRWITWPSAQRVDGTDPGLSSERIVLVQNFVEELRQVLQD